LQEVKYEITEQDQQIRDQILSLIMGRHLVQGIAYFCLVESGKPMSPYDITRFLKLSNQSYTCSISKAVGELVKQGLVKSIT